MSARRLLLATVIPAALLAGPVAGSASADTPPPGAVSGASGTVTFAAAAAGQSPITKIEVDLPTGTPLRDVTVPAMAGWTSATTKAALPSCGDEAVSSVTWTASGSGVAPQPAGEFAIQVGSFPATDQMEFTGAVTYADGRVVGFTQDEGVQAPGFAFPGLASRISGSAVTVNAVSTAPQPAVTEPIVTRPTVSQPIVQQNPFTSWMNTVVKFVMSVG
jgi:Domain of unkown function (DUF1775)